MDRLSFALGVEYLIDSSFSVLATYIVILFIILIIGPLINTFFITLSFKSVWLLLKSFFAYFISIPMFHGFFTSYSYVRCWDFTWGNQRLGQQQVVAVLMTQLKEV